MTPDFQTMQKQYGERVYYSKKVRLFPILFFEIYLTFTVVLFAFGPWPWPVENPEKLYSFLVLAQVALFLGYLHGIQTKPRGYFGKWRIESIVKLSIAINILMIIPMMYIRGGGQMNLLESLIDPGRVYNESRERALNLSYTVNLVEYVNVVVSPIKWAIVPLAFFYWRRLSNIVRIGCLISVIGSILPYIVSGTNKGIFDAIILFPWLVVAAKLGPVHKIRSMIASKRKANHRIPLKTLAFSVLLLFLAIVFFFVGQKGRSSTDDSAEMDWQLGIRADPENIYLRHFSPLGSFAAVKLISYVTQGYYGLSVCLEEPYVPMWGVGNSIFYTWVASRLVNNPEMLKLDYPSRAEHRGWDSRVRWASIYPWIASDFSFPGTILVVFFVGRLLALSWLDVLKKENPFAIIIFSFFVIMLMYFPANNQVMQTSDTAFAFTVTFLLWLFTRRTLTL
jgi:hypothetical protein